MAGAGTAVYPPPVSAGGSLSARKPNQNSIDDAIARLPWKLEPTVSHSVGE
jgi:hypothetical protein